MYDIYLEQAKLLHQNERKWRGTTLRQYIPEINKLRKEYNLQTMLDYGCGKAKHHPLEWNATKYDPAIPEFANKPVGKFDLVISTDVLEHIPVTNLKPIIDELFEYSNKWLFVSVCCRKAKAIYLMDITLTQH
jgi:hypothetical protein